MSLLRTLCARRGDPGGIEGRGGALTGWHDVCAAAEGRAEALAGLAGRSVWVHGEDAAALVAALAALDGMGAAAVLARPGGRAGPAPDGHVVLDADLMRLDGAAVAEPGPAHSVGVHSSGTTGRPRLVRWPWDALAAGAQGAATRGGRWISHYPADTFAGLQALLFGLVAADRLALAGPHVRFADAAGWGGGEAGTVRVAMATPTFWRRELLQAPAPDAAVQTLSMGGEPATQSLLDGLRERFPAARLVHVYASSELGSLFGVSDGRAGFPAAWLDRPRRGGAVLSLLDGQLHVAPAQGEPAVPTGDAMRVEGDRVVFAGRVGGAINVGGRKVDGLRVAEVLRGAPGVSDARVYAIGSAITGQLVAADLVLAGGGALDRARDAIMAHCRSRLEVHEQPRRLRAVREVAVTAAGKEAPGG